MRVRLGRSRLVAVGVALLMGSGGTVAVAGIAYVSGALDPYLNRTPPAQVAALTPPSGGTGGSLSLCFSRAIGFVRVLRCLTWLVCVRGRNV